jgi:hypothetical protein
MPSCLIALQIRDLRCPSGLRGLLLDTKTAGDSTCTNVVFEDQLPMNTSEVGMMG